MNKTIYGTDLTTIINKAINQNETNMIEKDKKIITLKMMKIV